MLPMHGGLSHVRRDRLTWLEIWDAWMHTNPLLRQHLYEEWIGGIVLSQANNGLTLLVSPDIFKVLVE